LKHLLSKTIKTALLASAAGAVVSFAMTSTAIAQTSDTDTAGGNEEIVVTGIRATLENALENKRKADVILDGISADDLGNFPDLNLGEALQRITGVQIDRSGDRRDATISVRGLPGAFTQTTVMGQNIASPRGFVSANRSGNPFGVFDSQIFNGADVEMELCAENLTMKNQLRSSILVYMELILNILLTKKWVFTGQLPTVSKTFAEIA